jgi:uncharacterized surface protein with fasciclin (FAS1) repeats
MINLKRPKSKTEIISEHLFELAAGLFVVMIVGLVAYIGIRAGTKNVQGSVAGLQTQKTNESENLLNLVAKNGDYKYFFDALTKTGLYKMLQEDKTLTILVPHDSAFKKLTENELTNLFADTSKLTQLVKDHIIQGKLIKTDFDRVEFIRAESGKIITINRSDFGTLFNNAKLMSSGNTTSNGITYELDSLIK